MVAGVEAFGAAVLFARHPKVLGTLQNACQQVLPVRSAQLLNAQPVSFSLGRKVFVRHINIYTVYVYLRSGGYSIKKKKNNSQLIKKKKGDWIWKRAPELCPER